MRVYAPDDSWEAAVLFVVLIVVCALVSITGIALLLDVAVRHRRLGQPGNRRDGLGDDLRAGMGINLLGGS